MDRLELMHEFVRIAELRSLSAAARALRCSEPTLSKRLRRLEESLGTRLLQRSTQGVRLTEGGERYLEVCKRLLAELREAEAELSGLRSSLRGTLRVYGPIALGEWHLARTALWFQRRHPELRIELILQDGWVDLVQSGADLAVRVGAVLDPSVVARGLGGYRYVLAAAPSYLARAGTPSRAEDLQFHEYLRYGGADEEPLATPKGEALLEVHAALAFNNSLAVKSAVLEGGGIGRVARWLVQEELDAGRLVEVLPGIAPPPVPVFAAYLPSRYPTEKVRSFVRFLAEALGGLSGWIPPAQLTPSLGAPENGAS